MMSKYKKKPKPKRPSDKLPPEEQQAAWDNYLDAHVGRQGARPRWEILVNPTTLDAIAFKESVLNEIDQLNISEDMWGKIDRTTRSERSEIYVQACKNVIDELPFLQKKVLKYYFGIDEVDPMTQEEVSQSIGIAQQNVSKNIERALKSLKVLIRKEMTRLVKKEIQRLL